MKKTTLFLLLSSLIFLLSLTSCQKKEELHIYSIIHEEETQALCDLFTKKTGIPATFLRATTGELVNRIIAEKDNPNADILLGGASSYHIQAAAEGALEAYISPLAEKVPDFAHSADGKWTGFCLLTLGIGINTKRYQEKFPEIKIPQSWEDLINEEYKGEIVLTNPVASSTAYLFVQNQLQRLGQEKGWEYLLKLAPLVGQFPDSGSAPAKLIGTGEYAIGISYLHALSKYKSEGFDVELIAPPQSVGDVDCIAITKNAKHLEYAKKFVDFMLSAEAQTLMSSIDFTIPVNPDASPAKGSLSVEDIDLIDFDSRLAAEEKNQVLEKWSVSVK
ncbi:MAG: ABC transporter substrate-binding protein [Treponema sp.]|nr:ABC transporter substrate-binding protein [Treponema sp.]